MKMFDVKTVSMEWGGKTLTLETGRIARQADGAVLATYGETVVLCAVTAARISSRSPSTTRKSISQPAASRAASSSVNAARPKRKRWFPA
jgi:ribonuclease PH